MGPGGAQQRFGISADLVMLGKILGGGLPVGAVAGSEELMDQLAPTGSVYQAGTLSGNPLAMAAGIATMSLINTEVDVYERVQNTARSLVRGLVDAAEYAEVPMVASAIGGLAGFFFAQEDVLNYDDARATEADPYARFFRGMLHHGVYLPPSRFEALFISAAHTEEHVDRIVDAARTVMTTP